MDLSQLNPRQTEAVEYFDGPLLVLAGAGSGKTRVLTSKVARIIDLGYAPPERILAMTFTNKAAGEMRRRVSDLLPGRGDRVRMGTFHSICAWILRREAHHLGYSERFTIYDADDQRTLLRRLLKQKALNASVTPGQAKSYISRQKNAAISPEESEGSITSDRDRALVEMYRAYQEHLRDSSAFDFDDLLTTTLTIYRQNDDIREYYSGLFAYILVDEYQDTNFVQHQLLREMVGEGTGVCVVGDDDQSIYAWRGACVENMLEFEKDFPGTKTIKLEENYRSSGNILRGAAALVGFNSRRLGKTLWTSRDKGEPIKVRVLYSEVEEAKWIAGEIDGLVSRKECPPDSVAVLYRTNAQSRHFETECRRRGLDYEVVGSQRFYERAEIKDIVAYLRLILNPQDRISVSRMLNRPARGIGAKGQEAFLAHMGRMGAGVVVAMGSAAEARGITSKGIRELERLAGWFSRAVEMTVQGSPAAAIVDSLLENVDITGMYSSSDVTDQSRLENIAEFRRSVAEYDCEFPEGGLPGFMNEISLATTVDEYQGEKSGKVALMTLHCAKGLEFHTVFIAGLEEGMLPFIRAGEYQVSDIEEERRLLYVGITRAMYRLYLTCALGRVRPGVRSAGQSRFISEIAGGEARIPPPPVKTGSAVPPRPESASGDGEVYERGNLISHPRYGKGLVLKAERRGEDWQIRVDFGMDEPKTLVTGYVPIPVVKRKASRADLYS